MKKRLLIIGALLLMLIVLSFSTGRVEVLQLRHFSDTIRALDNMANLFEQDDIRLIDRDFFVSDAKEYFSNNAKVDLSDSFLSSIPSNSVIKFESLTITIMAPAWKEELENDWISLKESNRIQKPLIIYTPTNGIFSEGDIIVIRVLDKNAKDE